MCAFADAVLQAHVSCMRVRQELRTNTYSHSHSTSIKRERDRFASWLAPKTNARSNTQISLRPFVGSLAPRSMHSVCLFFFFSLPLSLSLFPCIYRSPCISLALVDAVVSVSFFSFFFIATGPWRHGECADGEKFSAAIQRATFFSNVEKIFSQLGYSALLCTGEHAATRYCNTNE